MKAACESFGLSLQGCLLLSPSLHKLANPPEQADVAISSGSNEEGTGAFSLRTQGRHYLGNILMSK